MNIHEYQAKELFRQHGIPVPVGRVATSAEQARDAAEAVGEAVVVKAQVHTGGRGKAGGVRVARDPAEAYSAAGEILGMDIKGHTVGTVLVEPAVDIASEIYLGIVLDRAQRRPIVMASREGGVEIEVVAARSPEAILKLTVDPLLGLQSFQARYLAFELGLEGEQVRAFSKALDGLFRVYADCDATLAEINPLVVTADGTILAVDGKMNIDDSGLYRQPAIAEMRDPEAEPEAERTAREAGLSYVDLDGSIGCLVNGAGLAMATMDVIKLFGGEPANFLDIGGGAQSDKVATAMRLLLADPNVRSVLVNIFGGITRGDEVARGVRDVLAEIETDVPFVVRIVGTNAAEARQILADADLPSAETLAEAAEMAVAAAGGVEAA